MVLNYSKHIVCIIVFFMGLQSVRLHPFIPIKDIFGEKISDSLSLNQWGIVSLSTINIRKEPNQQSELISQAIMGIPLKILNRKNNWLYIKTIDGYQGWTNYYSVKIMDNKQQLIAFWDSYPQYIFTDYFGIVHSMPDLKSDVVSDIIFNNIVRVIKVTSHFYEVCLPNGKKGYIEKQKLENLQDWIKRQKYHTEKLPEIAKKFLGFPYFWGGASSKGLDCSSFMQLIFFQQGIVLPRDAKLQVALGEEVDTSHNFQALCVGDLLFFGKKDITHVAMYIGNQRYIHCFGEVKINSLDSMAKDYNKKLKNMLVQVKRLEMKDMKHAKLGYFLYMLLEK